MKVKSRVFTERPIFLDGSHVKEAIIQSRPEAISGAYAFKWDYLESEILSKYVSNDTLSPELRANAAIEKLLDSERACKRINDDGYGKLYPHLESVLTEAKNVISSVLGDVPRDLFEQSKFTSGASTTRRRTKGHAYYKYDTRVPLHVTRPLRPYAEALITATPLWCSHGGYFNLKERPGNRITTVPKKTDIDRAIAIEPDMNMAMQTSIGLYIRKALKKFGIDLNNQGINQTLAHFGSKTGLVATIDLASASDSISYRLVWDLLPPAWFRYLEVTRSPFGELPDGKLLKWEKFSSMGNGYTFELESLLFYALMVGTYRCISSYASMNLPSFSTYWSKHTSIYGDDIICPSFMANDLIKVLDDVGFKTNTDKTFTEGCFRESCGKHYWNSHDVTPFYVRKPLDNYNRVIWFLNKLRKWSFDQTSGVCDPAVHALWLKIRRKYIPEDFLGGVDIDDDSSVYSEHMPRFKLINKVKRTKVDGYRAFLAQQQTLTHDVLHRELVYVNHKTENGYSSSNNYSSDSPFGLTLCSVQEHIWLRRRNVVVDPVLLWSPRMYLFPKEIR